MPGLTLALLLAGAGCSGQVGSSLGQGDSPGKTGGGGGGAGKNDPGGADGTGAATPVPGGTGGAVSTTFVTGPGLRRLTRAEYTNTVRDLFGLDVTGELPIELVVGGHGEIAGAQKTGYDDTNRYVDIGLELADAAAPRVAMQVGCMDDACLRTWATSFLTRAFRGPPTKAVQDRYVGMLLSTAPADAGTSVQERLTTFLGAVLASPDFLYRREVGTAAAGSDATVRSLDPYEVATRLSYLVWQSMPDAELAQAASQGALLQPAQRLAQLDRMLKDVRAKRGLRGFVADWMALFENNLGKKAPEVLKETGSDFPQVAEKGFALLVEDVLGAPTARFADLLKVDYVYANATLAKIFGLTTAPKDFQKVMLKTDERRGLLMQPLVIGAHSKESGASPFPLGKFLYENVLCEVVPPPPASFPPVEDTTDGTQTLRQRLEAMTSTEPCSTCHSRIGPPGFAFLPFDPIGRYKNADAKGMPYDTAGGLVLQGEKDKLPFASASDLAGKLAEQAAVQRCVARRLFRWSYGRYEGEKDAATVAELEKASVASGSGVTEILKQLVGSPAFGQVRIK